MGLKLSNADKVRMFKDLAGNTLWEVGLKHGLDKHYSKNSSVKNTVYRIYNEVKNEPDKFDVDEELVELVVENVSGRAVAPSKKEPKLAEKIQEENITKLLTGARNKAAKLIFSKLEDLERSKSALNNESIVSLGKIFGILFDKSQIIQGQATEHVAHMAKVDPSLSADEKLDMIIKLREQTVAEKNS